MNKEAERKKLMLLFLIILIWITCGLLDVTCGYLGITWVLLGHYLGITWGSYFTQVMKKTKKIKMIIDLNFLFNY